MGYVVDSLPAAVQSLDGAVTNEPNTNPKTNPNPIPGSHEDERTVLYKTKSLTN